MMKRHLRIIMKNGNLDVSFLDAGLMRDASLRTLGKAIEMTEDEVRKLGDPLFCL